MRSIKFIFDLDGTITKKETLPIISKHFKIENEIDKLTHETIDGNIPFIESFIRRVHILSKLPIDEISHLLEKTSLHIQVVNFIQTHKNYCVIATGNLECWVDKLLARIGCQYYCSKGIVKNNQIIKLESIIKKESIVEHYKSQGNKVVFIGDGNNDVEAMRLADISIASGLTHTPAKSVLSIADYLICNEEALCRQLNQLL